MSTEVKDGQKNTGASEADVKAAADKKAADDKAVADAAAKKEADDKAAADAAAKKDEGAGGGSGAPKIPDSYDLKKPAGDLFTDEDVARYVAEAKALGYTQKQAEDRLARDAKEFSDMHAALTEGLKSDKDFGGDKFDASIATFDRGLDVLLKGSPEKDVAEIKAMFTRSGQKYNPAWHRVINRVLGVTKEDVVDTSGKSGGAVNAGTAEMLYGKDGKGPKK